MGLRVPSLPGPGTAMAFAAAVAAGAAGYSYSKPPVSIGLMVVTIILGFFTLRIEYLSGPIRARKMEEMDKRLAQVEKLNELKEKRLITKKEFQETKTKILSKI